MSQSSEIHMTEISRFVWRGALGGMIGPTGFVLYVAYSQPGQFLAIAYLPIILLVTAVVGALIGRIIAQLHFEAGLRAGIVLRLVVGVGFAACFWTIYSCLRGNEWLTVSWKNLVTETAFFASIMGAFPAILARPKTDVCNFKVMNGGVVR